MSEPQAKNLWQRCLDFLATYKIQVIGVLIAFVFASFVYFYFPAQVSGPWDVLTTQSGLVYSQGSPLFLGSLWKAVFGYDSLKGFSFAGIYVCLTILYFGLSYFLIKRIDRPFFFVLSIASLCLILFHPYNGNSHPSTAQTYLSFVLLSALFFLVFHASKVEAISRKIWISVSVLSVLCFFVFVSSWSYAVSAVLFVFALIKAIKEKRFLTPLSFAALIGVTGSASIILIAAISHNISGLLPGFFSIRGTIKNVICSLAPSSYGGLTPWDASDVKSSPFGKVVHLLTYGYAGLLGIAILGLLIICIVRKDGLKRPTLFLLVSMGLATAIHALYVDMSHAYSYDGALTLSSLSLTVLCLVEYRKICKAKWNFPETKPLATLYVRSIALCLVVIGSSLGSFGASTLSPKSYQADYNAMLTAGIASDIPVSSVGTSCLGLSAEETFGHVNAIRKEGSGFFSEHPITSDFKTSYYCYGVSGNVLPDSPRFDGWVSCDFRVLLNSGNATEAHFAWYLTDSQLGDTMHIYLDGELLQDYVCSENLNSLTFSGLEPNQNYYFKIVYNKKVQSSVDVRELGFILNDLSFQESAA